MKGSVMFWLSLLIAAILFGEYQMYQHIDTWRIKDDNTGASMFYAVNIIALVFWELIFGMCRGDDYSSDYNFKKEGFTWKAFSPLFLLYIIIKYYINPFLDRLLK